MVLISIFTISLIAVFGMLSLKVFENSRKKLTPVSVFLSSYDTKLEEKAHSSIHMLSDLQTKIHAFLKVQLPQQTKYFLLLLKKKIVDQYQSLLLNARGSRALKSGEVSAYLKDITKHKNELGGGRIDDMVE